MTVDDLKRYREIYDNVHGFIKVTKAENDIIDSLYFQRLRKIRQLGLVDYVFPGALHNRFNHSLGVMHLADKMIVVLQENGSMEGKRKLIRMAGLLHDIGHYPLSHLVESVVKEDASSKIRITGKNDVSMENDPESDDESFVNLENNKIHNLNLELHDSRNGSLDFADHERMGSIVIFKTPIYDILRDNDFSDEDIKIIAQIISGTYSGPEKLLINSELDADRFDYLLRDSQQTGVIYGSFDLDQIIRHIEIANPDNNGFRLVVNEKGRKALEHYLTSKYFMYSTLIYQKTAVGFEIMSKKVYQGLMERGLAYSYFDLIKMFENQKSALDFLDYTDDYFFNILRNIDKRIQGLDDNDTYTIKADMLYQLVNKLLNRQPLKMCYECQNFVPLKQASTNSTRLLPVVINDHAQKAGIETEWCIPFKIDVRISDNNPYLSLSEASSFLEEDTYQAIWIIKEHNNKKEIVALVEDETSIINVLSQHILKINRIYTKNDEYKQKYIKASNSS